MSLLLPHHRLFQHVSIQGTNEKDYYIILMDKMMKDKRTITLTISEPPVVFRTIDPD
jgi:hypothetical protein